jgi:hypothetical protein
VIDYLRLAFGTFVVLLPGMAVARAIGRRSVSGTLAWGLAAIFVAWAVVFTLHKSIHYAIAALVVIFVVALVVGRRRLNFGMGSSGPVFLFGVVLGWFLWSVQGPVTGDGLFHEARVRKLLVFGDLHLRSVDEFKDGGLHPGYAFPLWHGFLALVSWFSGLDPEVVVRHESSVLAPIACVVVWEAGVALFRSRWAGVSVLAGQLALTCFAPGHGGSWATLALPATAAQRLIAPAALALFFQGQIPATAAIFGALALTHPTYAIFLLIPLLAVVWWEWRLWLAAAIPTGLVLLWLKPIVDETISHNPSAGERLRALKQYGTQLVVTNDHHYRLAPEVLGRSGPVAVLALALLPVLALAYRKRWAQFALGGSLIILALMEVPWLFVHLADATSLSQARRAAGFIPFPFAFAGALALVTRRWLVVPAAFVAGLVLQLVWPGDFGYTLEHGGPAFVAWIALVGGALALVAALIFRPPAPREFHAFGAAAAVAFSIPVLVHGIWHWSPSVKSDPDALSPQLVHNLRTKVPRGAVVIAPLQTSYRLAAAAPLYIVAAPPTHVADTTANRPYLRVREIRHWVLTNDPKVAKEHGATWAIRSGRLYRLPR